ncbi:aminotransferase class I/II-fold pyridoxal phosphate-dependent enzyme [Tepidibacillus marianensis]|uniref:aminotransferase class I/II-fold pyridoxal phosphate-dependent enzyme n=1 Tax=Tepidibacillus marianensis TaxID=3131995 RepID=UPI0030D0A9B7
MRVETKLAQIGVRKETKTGAISYPVYYATSFIHPTLGESTGYDYTRIGNPTREVLEEAIACLEGGQAGFACSSGMAAIQIVMGLFSQGDHIVVSLDLYGGTYRLFEEVLSRFGLSFSYVDVRDRLAVKKVIRTATKAIFVETPTNPLMQVANINEIITIAKQYKLLTIVDNTFMTPFFQQPIKLGADIVVHSATKYLGGHNDVLAGLIVTEGMALSEKVRFLYNSIGAVLGPQDAWLLMRGMKTLALRMEKHQENAFKMVHYLQNHPKVIEVFYPGLEQARTIQESQASGFGGMLSFRVDESINITKLLQSLKVVSFAESLGGVESLITYPATQTHADIPEDIRKKVGIDDRLLRLSVGIEHITDLIEDLSQAFEAGINQKDV